MVVSGMAWWLKALGATLCCFAALMLLCVVIGIIEYSQGKLSPAKFKSKRGRLR